MVENNRYCVDVCKQLLAIPSLLRKANNLILRPHINSLRERAIEKGQGRAKVQEIFNLITQYSR